MLNDPDSHSTFKVALAWIGALAGGLTLSNVVLVATLIYTLLQIALVLRKLYKEFKK